MAEAMMESKRKQIAQKRLRQESLDKLGGPHVKTEEESKIEQQIVETMKEVAFKVEPPKLIHNEKVNKKKTKHKVINVP